MNHLLFCQFALVLFFVLLCCVFCFVLFYFVLSRFCHFYFVGNVCFVLSLLFVCLFLFYKILFANLRLKFRCLEFICPIILVFYLSKTYVIEIALFKSDDVISNDYVHEMNLDL